MEPALGIIRKLGGHRAVSAGIGVAYTATYRWTYPKERGGCGGIVPYRHIPALLKFAASIDVPLQGSDFLPPCVGEASA